MNSELIYLLEELDGWFENQTITVGELKVMIQNAFDKMEVDENTIRDSIQVDMF